MLDSKTCVACGDDFDRIESPLGFEFDLCQPCWDIRREECMNKMVADAVASLTFPEFTS